MVTQRSRVLLLLSFIVILILGCGAGESGPSDNGGDGGGGTGVPPDDSTTPTPHDYLIYKTTQRNNNEETVISGLKGLSLSDINTSYDITASADGSLRLFPNGFQVGTYNTLNEYSIEHYHTNYLIFTNENRLYRLPVYQTKSRSPQQMSSEDKANLICLNDYRRANDYAAPSNSRLVYKRMPTSADLVNCGFKPGLWFMVSADDSADAVPIALPNGINYVVDAVHDKTSGSVIGWLVVKDGFLTQYDISFGQENRITLNGAAIAVSSNAWLMTRTNSKNFVLNIDQKLYFYDPTNQQYSVTNQAALFEAAFGERISFRRASNGSNLFFSVGRSFDADNYPGESDLYSLDLNSGAVVKLTSVAGGIGRIIVTDSNVVFGTNVGKQFPAGKGVSKISHIGENRVEVVNSAMTQNVIHLHGVGQYFYINIDGKVMSIHEGNTSGITHDYHQIIGEVFGHKLFPAKFLLDTNYFIVLQDDPNSAAKRIHSIDAKSGSMIDIGALPNEAYLATNFEFIETLGHNHILIGIYHQGIRDLYYFDASIGGSLKRLTEHTSENENGVYYKLGN